MSAANVNHGLQPWLRSFAAPRLNNNSNLFISPLQQIAAIHIQRFAITKHRDYQRESDCCFSCSNHQNKENENLSADLRVLSRECDKCEIHRVQHDLDRQEQGDDVALEKESQDSDQKQHRAKKEIPVDRDHRSFFANTTAP